MASILPTKTYVASLFALPSKPIQHAATVASIIATPAQAPVVSARKAAHVTHGDRPPLFSEAEFRASLAASEAAMEAWEANERKFEAENGYRREVNSMALGAYAQARSGNFGGYYSGSLEEAISDTARMIDSMSRNAGVVWSSRHKVDPVARYEANVAQHGEARAKQLEAKRADAAQAAEMDLFVVSAVLAKTHGITEPLYRYTGGKVTFRPTEFSYGGQVYGRLTETGAFEQVEAPSRTDVRI